MFWLTFFAILPKDLSFFRRAVVYCLCQTKLNRKKRPIVTKGVFCPFGTIQYGFGKSATPLGW